MKVTVDEKTRKLTIEIDLAPADSKTGKSLVIASTHGNIMTEQQFHGKPVVVSVNAYVKK